MTPFSIVRFFYTLFAFWVLSHVFFVTGFGGVAKGQLISTEAYELSIAPDLWYNSVDGLMPGIRFRGEDPRTFLDGPHRLNAGIRLATRFPKMPVTWFVSYTHPVSALSSPGNEGALHVFASMRAGLHLYEGGINKRWQPGFDEFVSTDLHVYSGLYKRFDDEYLIYKSLWQHDSVFFVRGYVRKRDENRFGRWTIHVSALSGLPVKTNDVFIDFETQQTARPEVLGVEGLFGTWQFEGLQEVSLPAGFFTRSRFFVGMSSESLPPEQRFLLSGASAYEWTQSDWTRSRGTLPPEWTRNGLLHLPGGTGLRGYNSHAADQMETGINPWVQHAVSFNIDLYYPNPINSYFLRIPYLGDILRLESYLFYDAGFIYDHSGWQDLLMNGGAGFMLSLNIPDYLGQNRGFFIRYELPLWVSDAPEGEDPIRVRHLLGLGAQYRF